MPRIKAKKSPLASSQPKQTQSKSKQELSTTTIGTTGDKCDRLPHERSPVTDNELEKYLDCSNSELNPSISDLDSDLASCYDDLETRLPVEGKVNPVLDHSVLVALLKAQNKENITVMQSMVEKTFKASTQSFKSEIAKHLAEMKSELVGLIDQQGKDFASFKKKFDERLTNIHSISKENVSVTNQKIEAVEKKIGSQKINWQSIGGVKRQRKSPEFNSHNECSRCGSMSRLQRRNVGQDSQVRGTESGTTNFN